MRQSRTRMSAFPKAAVQNVRIGIEPNVRFWPKADICRHEEQDLTLRIGGGFWYEI